MVARIRIDGPSYSPSPAPTPAAAPDKLTALVEKGDLNEVRAYFDGVFWENRAERPGWPHLKIALLHGDRQMMRLLHAWGAAPGDDDLATFRLAVKDKYPDYLKALRAAGMRPQNAPWETLMPANPEIPRAEIEKRAYEIYQENGYKPGQEVPNWLKAEEDLQKRKTAEREREAAAEAARLDDIVAKRDAAQLMKKVPDQWLSALKTLQDAGAGEAVIAGDALRDLFQERSPGGVDIFVLSRGDPRRNEKFLKTAFAATRTSATVTLQLPEDVLSGYKPSPARPLQHWTISVGEHKNRYNVTFVDQPPGTAFRDEVLAGFDLGLRQVACDGRQVTVTPAYRDDVAGNRISLLRARFAGQAGDLRWLMTKYPDWAPNAAAKGVLAPPPASRLYKPIV